MFIINGNRSYNTDHILKFFIEDDKVYAVFNFNPQYGCKEVIYQGDDAEDWLNKIHCAIQRGENAWWIKE